MLPENSVRTTLWPSAVPVYLIKPAWVREIRKLPPLTARIQGMISGKGLISLAGISKLNLNRYARRILPRTISISMSQMKARGVFLRKDRMFIRMSKIRIPWFVSQSLK